MGLFRGQKNDMVTSLIVENRILYNMLQVIWQIIPKS